MVSAPFPPSEAQHGDLYVHQYDKHYQIWLCHESTHWITIHEGHPHPTLEGYVLQMRNGVPGWVKKETIRTYLGRDRKKARERATAPADGRAYE